MVMAQPARTSPHAADKRSGIALGLVYRCLRNQRPVILVCPQALHNLSYGARQALAAARWSAKIGHTEEASSHSRDKVEPHRHLHRLGLRNGRTGSELLTSSGFATVHLAPASLRWAAVVARRLQAADDGQAARPGRLQGRAGHVAMVPGCRSCQRWRGWHGPAGGNDDPAARWPGSTPGRQPPAPGPQAGCAHISNSP